MNKKPFSFNWLCLLVGLLSTFTFPVFGQSGENEGDKAEAVLAPVEAAPVEAAPVEAAPVEAAPVEAAPVEPAGAPIASTAATATIAPADSLGTGWAFSGDAFNGSALGLRNSLAVTAFDKSAAQTYTPTDSIALDIHPRYWLGKTLYLRSRLEIQSELSDTAATMTTRKHEAVLNDLGIWLGASKFYTIPVVDVAVTAELGLAVPTSKNSQFQTMLFRVNPKLAFGRSFDLMRGLEVVVGLGYSESFNRSNTTEVFGSSSDLPGVLPSASTLEAGYAPLTSGGRNLSHRLSPSARAVLKANDWLSFYAWYLGFIDFKYEKTAIGNLSEPSFDVNVRETSADAPYDSSFFFEVAANAIVWKNLAVGVGVTTFSPTRAPDSSLYGPFNRNSTVFVELGYTWGGDPESSL